MIVRPLACGRLAFGSVFHDHDMMFVVIVLETVVNVVMAVARRNQDRERHANDKNFYGFHR